VTLEFVVFDREGNEVDSVDPYTGHTKITGGFMVSNHFSSYPVFIPEGGSYEIREWVER
jgi:hypothetical protein